MKRLAAVVSVLIVVAGACNDSGGGSQSRNDGETPESETDSGSGSGTDADATEAALIGVDLEQLTAWSTSADEVCAAALEASLDSQGDGTAPTDEAAAMDALRRQVAILGEMLAGLEAIEPPEGLGAEPVETYVDAVRSLVETYDAATSADIVTFEAQTPALDSAFLDADVSAFDAGALECVTGDVADLQKLLGLTDEATEALRFWLPAPQKAFSETGATDEEADCATAQLAQRYTSGQLQPDQAPAESVLAEVAQLCETDPPVVGAVQIQQWRDQMAQLGLNDEELDCATAEMASRYAAGEISPTAYPDGTTSDSVLAACLDSDRRTELLVNRADPSFYLRTITLLTDEGLTLEEALCTWEAVLELYEDGTVSVGQRPTSTAVKRAILGCLTSERLREIGRFTEIGDIARDFSFATQDWLSGLSTDLVDTFGFTPEEAECTVKSLSNFVITGDIEPGQDIDIEIALNLVANCTSEERYAELLDAANPIVDLYPIYDALDLAEVLNLAPDERDCVIEALGKMVESGDRQPGESPTDEQLVAIFDTCIGDGPGGAFKRAVDVLQRPTFENLVATLTDRGLTLEEAFCVWDTVVQTYVDGEQDIAESPHESTITRALVTCLGGQRATEVLAGL